MANKKGYGADQLTKTLNGYIGEIVDRVLLAGGDILNFAGPTPRSDVQQHSSNIPPTTPNPSEAFSEHTSPAVWIMTRSSLVCLGCSVQVARVSLT